MLTALLLLSGALLSETPDTLQNAVVTAERGIVVSRKDTLSLASIYSATDLALQSPGLIVSGYGGLAGVGTVNLRGLGTAHTSVYIDGIKVGNVQSGQPDLGMLPLADFGGAIVDYAQNSLNFNTERPGFGSNAVTGKVRLDAGSFGTFLPYGRISYRLSDKTAVSASLAGIRSNGDHPYGDGLRRANNDIGQVKTGLDLTGLTGGGDWMVKAFLNTSQRGTPGSVDWPSTDRQADRNVFLQGLLRKEMSPIYSMSIAGKISRDDVQYLSDWGDSEYHQNEVQFNTSHRFSVCRWLDLSGTAEFQWDGLTSSGYDASRTDVATIAGATLKLKRFRSDLTVQYEGTFDKGGQSANVVSPSADFRLALAEGLDAVGFARRAFRSPTFNELYYPGYGNPLLKPEDAFLTDLGMDFHRPIPGGWTLKAKADLFYNQLKDKIVSAPSPYNPSLWLPYNAGEASCKGLDALAGASFASGGWRAGMDARYSFQDAENIPYCSRHTVVVTGVASYEGWTVNAAWNYRGGRRDAYGEMPDWNTVDLVLGKSVGLGTGKALAFRIIGRNLADCRYELVTGYPMEGRSLTGGIEFSF